MDDPVWHWRSNIRRSEDEQTMPFFWGISSKGSFKDVASTNTISVLYMKRSQNVWWCIRAYFASQIIRELLTPPECLPIEIEKPKDETSPFCRACILRRHAIQDQDMREKQSARMEEGRGTIQIPLYQLWQLLQKKQKLCIANRRWRKRCIYNEGWKYQCESNSLTVIKAYAMVEPELEKYDTGRQFQFMRTGYFCLDSKILQKDT